MIYLTHTNFKHMIMIKRHDVVEWTCFVRIIKFYVQLTVWSPSNVQTVELKVCFCTLSP